MTHEQARHRRSLFYMTRPHLNIFDKVLYSYLSGSGVGRSIIGGGPIFIYLLFTELKNNRFQKKLIMQNTN